MPQSLATRARIVLLAANGVSNTDIAERLGLSKPTVGTWRKRYLAQRLAGLYDEPRPGGPRSIHDEEIAALLRKTLKTKPKGGTHWTCRSIAAETKLSKSTVQRVWKAFGLQPHRQKHFKISTDPFFVEKVRDIVGLSTPRTMLSSSVSTRRARSKRSIARNPRFRWVWDTSKA
jgi:putative transposase